MNSIFSLLFLLVFSSCDTLVRQTYTPGSSTNSNQLVYQKVGDIALPAGYSRSNHASDMSDWLRSVKIKIDNTVYLYNGTKKTNQDAQFAVLDISVGTKDLQQCADAVMRMRADFLFDKKRFAEIQFVDNNKKVYKWSSGNDRRNYQSYLDQVFGWCGSASLSAQLKSLSNPNDIRPGDVLIRGGYPGHAMLVMDVAVDNFGNRVFMLAQSYMPAQDIHIVKNPLDPGISPWFKLDEEKPIVTPEWSFEASEFKRW